MKEVKPQIMLQQIIRASGWSQEETARHLNVSFVTLNNWLAERSAPRAAAVESIRSLYYEVVGEDDVDQSELEALTYEATGLRLTARQIVHSNQMLDSLVLHLTYHTNTIEGSTMTLADTQAVLFESRTLANRTQIEQIEAQNHRAALLWLLDCMQSPDFVIDEALILGLHLRLMNGILSDAGQYRRHAVRIMGTRVAVANYLKIPDLIARLVADQFSKQQPIVSSVSVAHATFEQIHPFSDGNGRVGRLLALAQSLQAGYVPPLVLREKRSAYYKYLELAQTSDKYTGLEYLMAQSMLSAGELLDVPNKHLSLNRESAKVLKEIERDIKEGRNISGPSNSYEELEDKLKNL